MRNLSSSEQARRVAISARSKLLREVGKGDMNLRVLIGHANLLDSYMGSCTISTPQKQQISVTTKQPNYYDEDSDSSSDPEYYDDTDSDDDSYDEDNDVFEMEQIEQVEDISQSPGLVRSRNRPLVKHAPVHAPPRMVNNSTRAKPAQSRQIEVVVEVGDMSDEEQAPAACNPKRPGRKEDAQKSRKSASSSSASSRRDLPPATQHTKLPHSRAGTGARPQMLVSVTA